MSSQTAIIRNFNNAAQTYDQAAEMQVTAAQKLVAWAAQGLIEPKTILDIGCGTGLVSEELYRLWPQASITALDAAPAMIDEVRRKMPQVTAIVGDALTYQPPHKFDAIFSSMLLHWLPDPRAALQTWRRWLNPGGHLFVALPVEGSFQEWRDLCRAHGLQDKLWPLPHVDFADDLAERHQIEKIEIIYPTAADFVRSLKKTGANTVGHSVENSSTLALRQVTQHAAKSFMISCALALLQVRNQGVP
jgi:malonyl-CoA O-methyltransferase